MKLVFFQVRLEAVQNFFDNRDHVDRFKAIEFGNIVDPRHCIRFVTVNDQTVGRNPDEVLRVLDALQTGALCPCNWHPGEAVLTPVV